jgi:hypothetical protein
MLVKIPGKKSTTGSSAQIMAGAFAKDSARLPKRIIAIRSLNMVMAPAPPSDAPLSAALFTIRRLQTISFLPAIPANIFSRIYAVVGFV